MCAPWTTRSIECVPKRTDCLAVLPSKNGQSFRGESLYTRGTDCPTPGIRPVLTHRAAVDFDTPHKRAGLTKRGVHILRHTFCSHLAMKGAPARAIQELAGHESLSRTQRYMHLSPAAIDRAIRLLDGDIVETAEAARLSS